MIETTANKKEMNEVEIAQKKSVANEIDEEEMAATVSILEEEM